MSKKTARASRRVSQKELRRQEYVRQKRRRTLLTAGVAVVAVAVVGVLAYFRFWQPDIEGVVNYGPQERGHDDNVIIETGSLPPVGGVHSPFWQNCGIYTEPVEPKYAIHSMEHGAVWLTYRPDLPEDEVASLQDLVSGQSHLLMSPYPGQESDVVLTAWGLQLVIDSAPDDRVQAFIQRYRQGPQTPEPGAACSGGIGTPVG